MTFDHVVREGSLISMLTKIYICFHLLCTMPYFNLGTPSTQCVTVTILGFFSPDDHMKEVYTLF